MSSCLYRSPLLSVDVIVETIPEHIVLIKRANPPYGWALPGGYVDFGENPELAAIREIREETSLDIQLFEQFYTYSFPIRDNNHTITTVFLAKATGIPKPGDDAQNAKIFQINHLPSVIPDHQRILNDYVDWKKTGVRPLLVMQEKEDERIRATA